MVTLIPSRRSRLSRLPQSHGGSFSVAERVQDLWSRRRGPVTSLAVVAVSLFLRHLPQCGPGQADWGSSRVALTVRRTMWEYEL